MTTIETLRKLRRLATTAALVALVSSLGLAWPDLAQAQKTATITWSGVDGAAGASEVYFVPRGDGCDQPQDGSSSRPSVDPW